jgi:hypothetical protein
MKSLGAWFPDNVRNSVFGMFGTCAFAGGIGGTALAVCIYFNNKLISSNNGHDSLLLSIQWQIYHAYSDYFKNN